MRYNLLGTTYGNLVAVLIFSWLVCVVVSNSNADAVVASASPDVDVEEIKKAATIDTGESADTNYDTIEARKVPPSESGSITSAEILPNYETIQNSNSDVPFSNSDADESIKTDANVNDNDISRDSSRLTNINTVSEAPTNTRSDDASINPISGEGGEVISEVPLQVKTETTLDGGDQAQEPIAPSSQRGESLPDVTDIPTVTVSELPIDMIATTNTINTITIDVSNEFIMHDNENRTLDALENSNEALHKEEQIIKINDSGGGEPPSIGIGSNDIPMKGEINENIPSDNMTTGSIAGSLQQNNASDSTNATVNRTSEEAPIPVFSEWAQKQMEAAEKQQAMEQDVVNTSTQKKNHTNGNGKPSPLKRRAKNYASPDCGAKIIASNADASNTAAVLSSSKDEYMLSPCGNRIWFVVELCEAVQAQKIDLANFELFSSSPKNFTVAVSNRFPTRDWLNVGQFIAEDKRNVQSFELHPHLFGKFVRVDIHSHYSKEHFCPVSLFRVFGTSEFEAFETENQPNDDLEDFDEEFGLEQAQVMNSEQTIFKSASDAVLSIVKKAAEVLVKPVSNFNRTETSLNQGHICRTPAFGQFNCAGCSEVLVERINNALSCEYQQLSHLLDVQGLQKDLLTTQVCAKQFGIDTKNIANDCEGKAMDSSVELDIKQSYFLNLLPADYIGALCQLLLNRNLRTYPLNNSVTNDKEEVALNLTIEKKYNAGDFNIQDKPSIYKPESSLTTPPESTTESQPKPPPERNEMEEVQVTSPQESHQSGDEPKTDSESLKDPAPDINIYNVPIEEEKSSAEGFSEIQSEVGEVQPTITPSDTTTETSTTNSPRSEEDTAAWESLDNLLTATATTPGSNSQTGTNAAANGANSQTKMTGSPQSESVFIRLSNRIKALERNMSLSGQYLEELSRTYKKQVEELQQTLTQQTQMVRNLEDESRRHGELEQMYEERNLQLKGEITELTLQLHASIIVIILVSVMVFLLLLIVIVNHRSVSREVKALLTQCANEMRQTPTNSTTPNPSKLRRKSFEDFSDHQQNGAKSNEKHRRPSEEAMLILKECGDTSDALITKTHESDIRQRKHSICYDSPINANDCVVSNGNENNKNNARTNQAKCRIDKFYCPNTTYIQSQARYYLKQLIADDISGGYVNKLYSDNVELNSKHDKNPKVKSKLALGSHIENIKASKSKRKPQNFKRHESAPGDFVSNTEGNCSAPAVFNADISASGSNQILDDEDLDNFLPNTDLAYNEFMPEGPSGYQIIEDTDTSTGSKKMDDKTTLKKTRRLSSPSFFKSPFSKSLRAKATTALSKTTPPHEPTSWEWYRSKKSEAHQQKQNKQQPLSSSTSAENYLYASPTISLDSSHSEVQHPTNAAENSFRILEEAILSSGEGDKIPSNKIVKSLSTNGNSHSASSGTSSSSNHSSTSSSSKKKSRTFNKIFRKVF